jgi:hypothetical protein
MITQHVWVIGSMMVYWAYRSARGRHGGLNQGLQYKGFNLHWLGSRGLKWESLIPMIEKSLLTQPLPHILIIQLVSNDLGIVKGLRPDYWHCASVAFVESRSRLILNRDKGSLSEEYRT